MGAALRSWETDLSLRLVGAALCAGAWAAGSHLPAMHVQAAAPGALAVFLAAVAFLCGSGGSALAVFGRHILDEVEVSQRWQVARPQVALEDPNSNPTC